MTKGITYEQWRARYGVPPLDSEPTFRDDDRDGPWSCFDTFDVRTATSREIKQAGYSEPRPGECFCRLSRVWGVDPADITPLVGFIVFAVAREKVPVVNRAPDDFFDLLWETLTARGAKPTISGGIRM